MTSRRPIACLAGLTLLTAALMSSPASADTVLQFDLAPPVPDVSYTSGVLSTVSDGDMATDGDRNTTIFGFLPGLPGVGTGSLTLSGIMNDGDAVLTGPSMNVVQQATNGGSFSLFDDSNMLLLSGNLGSGFISGFTASGGGATPTIGSFLTGSPVTFTGGSLLPQLDPNSGALSISFSNVRTNGVSGMVVDNGTLLDFTAVSNGAIDASAVPEPSVLGMAALGAVAMIRRRRRRAAKKV